ncbi:MAG: ribokinase [Euzebya sp.]
MIPPHLVVVGSIVTDLAFEIPSRPRPGEVILATSFGRHRGGKGYNQAVAAARLGARVTMVGAIGDDDFGEAFLEAFEREGIDASRVMVMKGVPTAVAIPLITPDGDVGFVHYPGAASRLDPSAVARLPDCDSLLLQGEVPTDVNLAAARSIASRGGRVVLNPAPIHHISPELTQLATLITPNEVEAAALLGVPADNLDGRSAAESLRTPTRDAVVTLGARGASWATTAGAGTIAPPTVAAIDATAAGDSFTAGLAVALSEGCSYPDALRFAAAAGAYATTIRGAEPSLPRRADVDALLNPLN